MPLNERPTEKILEFFLSISKFQCVPAMECSALAEAAVVVRWISDDKNTQYASVILDTSMWCACNILFYYYVLCAVREMAPRSGVTAWSGVWLKCETPLREFHRKIYSSRATCALAASNIFNILAHCLFWWSLSVIRCADNDNKSRNRVFSTTFCC